MLAADNLYCIMNIETLKRPSVLPNSTRFYCQFEAKMVLWLIEQPLIVLLWSV